MEKEIEVERDFVVTYNCHTDEYTVKGSGVGSKLVKGWEKYADHTCFVREIVQEDKSKEKVSWAIRKSTKEEDYNDFEKESRKPQTIRWTLKIPGGNSTGISIFVYSFRYTGMPALVWKLTVPKKGLKSKLSPSVINKVQWEAGVDDFSGMGIVSTGSVLKSRT